MLSRIAQVFSSQGPWLILPRQPVPLHRAGSESGDGDAVPFAREAYRLELSGVVAKGPGDPVSPSKRAHFEKEQRASAGTGGKASETGIGGPEGGAGAGKSEGGAGAGPVHELTQGEQESVEKLKRRDQEVRRHEQAHATRAGPHARGGPVYEFAVGPDGRRYAVSGHVSIDTSPVPGNPEATIRKAQTVRRAALAPADPSGADHAVAAQASRMEQQARMETAREDKAPGEDKSASAGGNEPGASGEADWRRSRAEQAYRRSADGSGAPGSHPGLNVYA